ncbi:hypothetical protein HPB48_004444 [Haemaphysalis longicornis]|uniref:Uncharacterized protein n=1 Tax=Haemaphysalis longicornis TaxID=44386 RepID=A0A9J6FZ83_HAELO|nr:hypothetical protein HPB48_004444 [Haemaphysalis longicornis]
MASCLQRLRYFSLQFQTQAEGWSVIRRSPQFTGAVDIPFNIELVFIHCKVAVPPDTIGACYRPLDSDPSFVGELYDAPQLRISPFSSSSVILTFQRYLGLS